MISVRGHTRVDFFYRRLHPIRIDRAINVQGIDITAANNISMLLIDGRLFVAGCFHWESRNKFSQVGEFSHRVMRISGGSNYSLVLLENGEVWECCSYTSGQSKWGEDNRCNRHFKPVKRLPGPVKSISAGLWNSFVLLENGETWVCGHNRHGQLGLGDTRNRSLFEPLKSLSEPVKSIIAGQANSFVLLENGEVWGCGANRFGELGMGETQNRDQFEPVKNLHGPVKSIRVGGGRSFVLLENGEVWRRGNNESGELGLGYFSKKTYTNFKLIPHPRVAVDLLLLEDNLRCVTMSQLVSMLEHILSLLDNKYSEEEQQAQIQKFIDQCVESIWPDIDEALQSQILTLTPKNIVKFQKKFNKLLEPTSTPRSKCCVM